MEKADSTLRHQIHRVLGRSPAVREVNAGSCNGCEPETVALDNPVYDIERFGIHFVASPCHADLLPVTGPVTRNRELALRKTYDASRELDPQLHTHAVAANLTFDGATSDGYLRPTGLLVGGLPQCVGLLG
jgi:Ni,Fe-hydrogenase III small subunit